MTRVASVRAEMIMKNRIKYNQILDALQELLKEREIRSISVSEIAHKAGIGKGSIYYYFPSKEAILDALIERNYEQSLETAKNLAKQTDVSPFTRMAMLFQVCRSSSEFLRQGSMASELDGDNAKNFQEKAFLHQKYIKYLVSELKPVLTEIIKQGIDMGVIQFEYPAALAEIVLIVLSVKMDNYLIPATAEEVDETIHGLITLLEKGTDNPPGSLDFLTLF